MDRVCDFLQLVIFLQIVMQWPRQDFPIESYREKAPIMNVMWIALLLVNCVLGAPWIVRGAGQDDLEWRTRHEFYTEVAL